ncbi:MAG: hypothetical protein AAFU72_03445 [Pseudomonadota bacterium]
MGTAIKTYLIAGVLTAVVPLAVAYIVFYSVPAGCDVNAWLCLFPVSLMYLAPCAAVAIPLLFYIAGIRHIGFVGWIVLTLLVGSISQMLISGWSLFISAEYMRRIYFYEILIFPQGFAAGALCGAVFGAAMAGLRKAP